MAYVIHTAHSKPFENDGKEYSWYINGFEKPILARGERVVFFIADGDELREIRKLFLGIPVIFYDGICKWREPFAQFLFDNL